MIAFKVVIINLNVSEKKYICIPNFGFKYGAVQIKVKDLKTSLISNKNRWKYIKKKDMKEDIKKKREKDNKEKEIKKKVICLNDLLLILGMEICCMFTRFNVTWKASELHQSIK